MQQYLITLSLLLLTLTACEPEEKPIVSQQSKAIPVRVKAVTPLESLPPILAVGQVVAGEDLFLGFRTGGVIKKVYVQEGQRVQAGQLLAELDLVEVSAQMSQATAGLAKATRDLDRVTRLFQDTVATLEQVQDLTTARDVAAAQLQLAESQQRHARLIAPASGRVLKRMAQQGEVAGPGSPVFQLGSEGDARVLRVGLADVDVVQVALGDEAKVSFDAWPGEVFSANITEIAPSADPRTGTYAVELTFSSIPQTLKNGFVGKAEITRQAGKPMAKIPMSAIARADRDSAWVFLPQPEGQAKLVKVGPVTIGDGYVAVPWEQLPGSEIVTEGAAYLREGLSIRIIDSVAAAPSLIGQR